MRESEREREREREEKRKEKKKRRINPTYSLWKTESNKAFIRRKK